MMKKIMALMKVDFNTTYGISSLIYNFRNKKNRWPMIVLSLAMLSLLPTYILTVKGLSGIYDIYKQLGQESVFLLLGFLGSQIIIFIFGLLYVMSKYYFSNDLESLVALPIKPSHIFSAKFATLMVSEYLTSLPIILPFIIIYGIKGGQGASYWIYSLLLIASLPVIPLVLASILVMFFMKYTNIGGKKDFIRVVGAIVFIIVIIFFQFFIQNIASKAIMQGDNFIMSLIEDSNLLVKKLGVGFPPSKWGALALVNSENIRGLLYIGLFVGLGLVSIWLMIYLSEGIFFDGLIGNMEVSASKGRKDGKISGEFITKKSKPYLALCKKELIMLFKTPIYFLNSVGVVIILPLMLIMPTIIGGNNQSLNALLEMIETNPQWVALIGIGLISTLGIFNSVGSTTFSREGKNFWIQRTLPIKVMDQILGRVLASLFIQVLAVIILCVSLSFVVSLDITTIILITFLGLLGSIPMTQIGMIIDIIRPMLDWDNPQKAIKQNLNVLISMGVGVLYGGGIGFLIIKLINKISINLIYTILALLFVLTSLVLVSFLKKLITKQFELWE